MTFKSRFQRTAFRPGAALARDRRRIEYQGVPEDQLRLAWRDAFLPLRAYWRSPAFASQLEAALQGGRDTEWGVAGWVGWIDAQIDQAMSRFQRAAEVVFTDLMTGKTRVTKAAGEATARPLPIPSPTDTYTPRLNIPPANFPNTPGQHYASPYHIFAARRAAGNLVTYVGESTRAKIRTQIVEAIERGIDATATAHRISRYVGLFPRWQDAVDRLYDNMIDHGIPERLANKRADDYADELVDKRGLMIARTEIMRASNYGRLAQWGDMSDRGLLDPDLSWKLWISAPDACPECDYMGDPNGDGVPSRVQGLDGMFDTPYGEIPTPPMHPHCRCTINIEPVQSPESTA